MFCFVFSNVCQGNDNTRQKDTSTVEEIRVFASLTHRRQCG